MSLVNNSSKDEEVDERKRRRMIMNRESARHSREKKEQHVQNLNDQITQFMIRNKEKVEEIKKIEQLFMTIDMENTTLRMEGDALKKRLMMLEELQIFCNASDDAVENYDNCLLNYILQDCSVNP
ncbi:hypothetical protein ACS0TY_007501 [Phlomoides rotata]